MNSNLVLHLQGEQVLLCELQVIIIPKPPKNSPGGLMPTSLYEEGVQKKEACKEEQKDSTRRNWYNSKKRNITLLVKRHQT